MNLLLVRAGSALHVFRSYLPDLASRIGRLTKHPPATDRPIVPTFVAFCGRYGYTQIVRVWIFDFEKRHAGSFASAYVDLYAASVIALP
jgi:hypothetical protein